MKNWHGSARQHLADLADVDEADLTPKWLATQLRVTLIELADVQPMDDAERTSRGLLAPRLDAHQLPYVYGIEGSAGARGGPKTIGLGCCLRR
jgi:hypothetical protein